VIQVKLISVELVKLKMTKHKHDDKEEIEVAK
jgi:hypothetical protein